MDTPEGLEVTTASGQKAHFKFTASHTTLAQRDLTYVDLAVEVPTHAEEAVEELLRLLHHHL